MQKSPIYVRTDIRKEAPMVLAIFWLAGILFGAACCYVSTEDTVSLMRGICAGPVSIVGVMNAVFVPFLLSVVFIMLSMKRMLMVLCFLKAFLFSFVSVGILASCGSSGWLLRYFLLFCDCTMLPMLYWYWRRAFTGPAKHLWISSVFACCIILLTTVLDYRVIAPSVRQIL